MTTRERYDRCLIFGNISSLLDNDASLRQEFRRTCDRCENVFVSEDNLFNHQCYNTPTRTSVNLRTPPPVKPKPKNISIHITHSPVLLHPEIEDVETEINELQCPVCWDNKKTISGSCGHQLCCGCSKKITSQFAAKCPQCRAPWKEFRIIY
jgi:hypothetical protein